MGKYIKALDYKYGQIHFGHKDVANMYKTIS